MFATRRALVATTASWAPSHWARAGLQTTKAIKSVADQSYNLDGFGGDNPYDKDNDPLDSRAASKHGERVDDSCVRQVCGTFGGGCLSSDDVKTVTEDDTNEYCWGVHPHGQESKTAFDNKSSSSTESTTSFASGGVAEGVDCGPSP